MPKDTAVHSCVVRLKAKGMSEVRAIKICQAQTGQSYKTGKKSKGKYGYKYKRKRSKKA